MGSCFRSDSFSISFSTLFPLVNIWPMSLQNDVRKIQESLKRWLDLIPIREVVILKYVYEK